MIKYENHCCDCEVPGYPCMGSSCPFINIPVAYCDECADDTYARYGVDGKHYCEEHMKKYLNELFDELTIEEQAEILGFPLEEMEV